MATTNGDVHLETAQSFATDYLNDLFANNRNLGAFEEETLDLNIKSKYDDLDEEEVTEEIKKHEESSSSSESEEESHVAHNTFSAPVHEEEDDEEPAVDSPLEPGHQTFQVNGHSEPEVEVASHNGDLNGVPEPNQSEFTSHSEFSSHSEVIEPEISQFRSESEQPGAQQVTAEEEEEADDVVAPIPTSRGKTQQETEDELMEMKFAKLGVSKDWWDSKRKETDGQKDNGEPVDKFKTIKQNIRKGNTRSLLARFENLSKVSE